MTVHNRTGSKVLRVGKVILAIILSALCLVLIFNFLTLLLFGSSFGGHGAHAVAGGYKLLDRFDNYIVNMTSSALDGIIPVEKVFMLSDSDQVAPEPDPDLFGITRNPEDLQSAVSTARRRLNGEDLLFHTDVKIFEESDIRYYLDETIFAVSWKQVINNVVYTFSEVKIQHPSQFRRFLADGKYGSDKQYLTSQMASSVNAVVASAGDFYKYRQFGLVVYNGQVERFEGNFLDNCFIDDLGDLVFAKAGELNSRQELEQFAKDRNVRFSLSFGPVLIEDGYPVVNPNYPLGEITDGHPRSALCQQGPLHYVLVTANAEGIYGAYPTLPDFANALAGVGIQKAYALDGGQTATIVMNDEVINKVSYGAQRYISDIIYFATAIPEHK